MSDAEIAEITSYVDIHLPPPDVPTVLLLFGTNQPAPVRIAADRHHRGLAPLIIATGGANRHDGTIEGQMFRRRLRDAGVPEDAIRVEDQSADTWQNVQLALPHLHHTDMRTLPLTAVSKWYHRRAVHAVRTILPDLDRFHAIGWEPIYAGEPVTRINWPTHSEGGRRVIREWEEIRRRVVAGEIGNASRIEGAWQ
ncbi:MAG: YdcF family protein [Sporichthyaceae bacterium]|nr:YdcF family protein [Sporichthyaceae bacterium]